MKATALCPVGRHCDTLGLCLDKSAMECVQSILEFIIDGSQHWLHHKAFKIVHQTGKIYAIGSHCDTFHTLLMKQMIVSEKGRYVFQVSFCN